MPVVALPKYSIKAASVTGMQVSKPDFIDSVTIISNNEGRIDVGLGESYTTELNFTALLSKIISEKEDRAVDYRLSVDVDYLWILIVIDDLKAYSGFNLTTPFVPSVETSKFESILLFEKFNGSIYVLHTKHS